MSKKQKTNVMRILDQAKISYTEHTYDGSAVAGVEVARLLGEPGECVFKTLVTEAKSGEHYVFMIPVAEELDLKKAARAVGEKSVSMLKSKELLPLTGYIHGGCSPIGMKTKFVTVIDETVTICDKIYFSGGRVGCQVEMNPNDLFSLMPIKVADVTA